MTTFTAQLDNFADLSRQKMELVLKQSAQDVFEAAQTPVAQGGNMPVDTGFLRNSMVAALNGAPAGTGPDAYVMAVAGADMGDTIFGGWTANYAKHVEYGAQGRAGRFFALSAARQWQAIVAANVAKARALK